MYNRLSCTLPNRDISDDAIKKLKKISQKYIQPQKNKKCTLMLLTNLGEPEWISINCYDQIIGDILCMVPRNVDLLVNNSQKADLFVFKNPCVLINGKCYLFSYVFQNDTLGYKNLTITSSTFIDLEHLVTAINGEFLPFHNQFTLTVYCKITNKWRFQKVTEPHKGLHVTSIQGSPYIKYENIFECEHGIFIAYVFVCDGKQDCPGYVAFDEMACTCKNKVIISNKCKYVFSNSGMKTCSQFYMTMKDGTCSLYSLFNRKNKRITNQKSNSSGSFKSIFKPNSKLTCQDNGQLSCRCAYTNCYNIAEICTYRLDENNLLSPCVNGEHIVNCRDIQCNMKFKCPQFYCIPWSYICDGKWDCPGGFDEVKELGCGVQRHCKNMFKCANSQACIHVSDVCNGLKDCPSNDDEYLCSLIGLICLPLCMCLGSAIKCYNISSENYLTSVLPYNILFCIYSDLVFLNTLLKMLKLPTALSLTYNNLRHVCQMLPGLGKAFVLDFGFNQIEHIRQDCFKNGYQITSIKLNDNLISIFYKAVLLQVINLNYLDLSNNFIINLFSDSHLVVDDLEILSIKNNTLSKISDSIFNNFNLKILITDKYFLCCKLPFHSTCTSVRLWFESCKHLLLQRYLTLYAFCFSVLLVFSNVFATFVQKIFHRRGKENYGVFQYVAISVNFIDFTWGIYLIILVICDLLFENNFIFLESLWKSSFICYFLFSVNLNYNILSPLLSSFLSFSRLMVVMYPLDSSFKNKRFVLKCCILMCGITITIMMTFIITFRHRYMSVPFRLCSPFIDPTQSNVMLRIATCVVLSLQFLHTFQLFTLTVRPFLN